MTLVQVGDIFQFSPGTIIPADGILVFAQHLIAHRRHSFFRSEARTLRAMRQL